MKIVEGTPVRDHVLKMISYLYEMEILGTEIDGKTQVNIIIESLPTSFDLFLLNYDMNQCMYTLTE